MKVSAGLEPSQGWEGEPVPALYPAIGGAWGPSAEFLGLWTGPPISAVTLTWHSPCVSIWVQISPFYKGLGHIALIFHPNNLILTSSVKTLFPN